MSYNWKLSTVIVISQIAPFWQQTNAIIASMLSNFTDIFPINVDSLVYAAIFIWQACMLSQIIFVDPLYLVYIVIVSMYSY